MIIRELLSYILKRITEALRRGLGSKIEALEPAVEKYESIS